MQKAHRKEQVCNLVAASPETLGLKSIEQSLIPSLSLVLEELQNQIHPLQDSIAKAAPVLQQKKDLSLQSAPKQLRPFDWTKNSREVFKSRQTIFEIYHN